MKKRNLPRLFPCGKHYVILSFLTLTLCFVWCTCSKAPADPKISTDNPIKGISINQQLDNTARFLAGRTIPKESNLYTITQSEWYKQYRQRTDSSWSRLQVTNQKKISDWKKKHLPKKYTKTIFYPFSGPDIINPLLFFPDGTDYIMFGLESPGFIPSATDIPRNKLRSGLNGLGIALDNVLNVNYFKTLRMEKEISTNTLNSITSVIMFFLSRMEYTVLQAKHIWIDKNSSLTYSGPAGKRGVMIPGVEIYFRKDAGSPVMRVRYFQLNVIDRSLARYTNFIPYLETYGKYTTIIKSASYLMHNVNKFTKIRAHTLSHSDFILQDDSGIALRYFDRKSWNLSFHGRYVRPVPLFAHRFQSDLDSEMKKNSTGVLPFSYGYRFRTYESNLMSAEKIKK